MKRLNLRTFSNTRKFLKKKATKVVGDDRELFARLVIVAQIRQFDLEMLFSYELSNTPLSIATSDGAIRKTQKSTLMNMLEERVKNIKVSDNIQIDHTTCVIYDLMAELQSSKTIANESLTFGDFAQKFVSLIVRKARNSGRIDIVSDRYNVVESIKTFERNRRSKGKHCIATKIHKPNVPVPKQ